MSADERKRHATDPSHDDHRRVGGDAEPAGHRDDDLTRRALIQAGWTLPVVLAVKLPTDAFAQYAHGDTGGSHDDAVGGHDDAPPHSDTHGDVPDHVDAPHFDHTDTHTDLIDVDPGFSDVFVDTHVDGSHVDFHVDGGGLHIDTPIHIDAHIDLPHIDHIDLHIDHIDLPHFDGFIF